MRKCPVCRAAHVIANQATEATGTIAKILFRTAAMFLTTLCFLCPLNARAEGSTPCPAELTNNSVVLLARIVKGSGAPPCKILSVLSGGRFNVVLPPKIMVNEMMDAVIVVASNMK